ncbi:hypothetical protein BDR22DRAFT_964252 [Usnea florida]
MAVEAVGLASSLSSLVATAYSSCQKLDSIFQGARNAPKHIKALSSDLEDFYLVLGTLQALLDDEELSPGVTTQATSLNLCNVLENCISVFKSIKVVASEYQIAHKRSELGTWQRLKWTFRESEIDNFRKDLMGCKATFNMSISVANFYNTRAIATNSARMEADFTAHLKELEKFPDIMQQKLEDIRVAQIPQAPPHGAIERASIKVDYNFALRHYMDGAESGSSEMLTPSEPSPQVSSFDPTSCLTTSKFDTAPMSAVSGDEADQRSRRCTQVLVRHVGLQKTITLQTKPEDTIETIKLLIRQKIGMPKAQFDLLYSSHVLRLSDRSLEEYNIPHDATLTCVSLRPERPAAANPPLAESIVPGRDHLVNVPSNATISDLKYRYTEAIGGNWTTKDVVLLWNGHNLDEDTVVSTIGVDEEDPVLHALLRYDEVTLNWAEEIAKAVGITTYQSMRQADNERSMHTIEWTDASRNIAKSERNAGKLASSSSLDAVLAIARGISHCSFGDRTIWYVKYA